MNECVDHVEFVKTFESMYKEISGQLSKLDKVYKVCLAVDVNIFRIYSQEISQLTKNSNKQFFTFEVEPGEVNKSMTQVDRFHNFLFENNLGRQDLIIAIGGGITTDLVGFAASIYLRGVKYILIPTTLLCMVDACYGGKTGVNNKYGKNQIGTFSKPLLIIINTCRILKFTLVFLYTSDERNLSNGMAEVIKVAAIFDEAFFKYLQGFNPKILHNKSNQHILEEVVRKSLNIKLEVVSQDRYETNSREILNFGHTIGHAIEYVSRDRLLHGECVSIGMILASEIALIQNPTNKLNILHYQRELRSLLTQYNLPTCIPSWIDLDAVMGFLQYDKKVINGRVRFILLERLGVCLQPSMPIDNHVIRRILFKTVEIVRDVTFVEGNQSIIGIPGSKSITNRVLLMAALGDGDVRLENFYVSEDIQAMIRCLKSVGLLEVLSQGDGFIEIKGSNNKYVDRTTNNIDVDVGESGTTARFIIPVCLMVVGQFTLKGGISITSRPMRDLLVALKIQPQFLGEVDHLPFTLQSCGRLEGGRIEINSRVSSQFISSLLMVAPYSEQPVELVLLDVELNEPIVSESFIEMTMQIMKRFGIKVTRPQRHIFRVPIGRYSNPKQFLIEPDATAATYDMASVALNGGQIVLRGLGSESCQGDYGFMDVLTQMGVEVQKHIDQTIITSKMKLKPQNLNIDCRNITDTFITLAIMMSTIPGRHTITGIENQRVKECNRISAVVKNLTRCGLTCKELQDGLVVWGQTIKSTQRSPRKIMIKTHNDHRIAMAFTILGNYYRLQQHTHQIVLDNKDCVNKTFPSFWEHVKVTHGIDHQPHQHDQSQSFIERFQCRKQPIIIIGMRGAGKSSLSRYVLKRKYILKIASKLRWNYVSLDERILKHLHKHHNFESLQKAVLERGWAFFRQIEKNKAFNIINKIKQLNPHSIIDCGGGLLENFETFTLIRSQINVVYIEKHIDTIMRESHDDQLNRPELDPAQTIPQIYNTRKPQYLKASNYIFMIPSTSEGSPAFYVNIQKQFKRFIKQILNMQYPYHPIYNSPSSFACSYIEDISDISQTHQTYNALELRLDRFIQQNLQLPIQDLCEQIRYKIAAIKQNHHSTLIITIRSKNEGGSVTLPINTTYQILKNLSKYCLGDLFDVELDFTRTTLGQKFLNSDSLRIILSKHITQGRVSEEYILNVIDEMKGLYAQHPTTIQLLKLVVHEDCLDPETLQRVINQPNNFKQSSTMIPHLVISMGPNCSLFRMLNNYMTPLALSQQTAPGQLTYEQQQKALQILNIQFKVGRYHLFGSPISKSPSDRLHNKMFDELNIDHNYHFGKMETLNINEIKPYLDDMNFKGASITLPFKQEILKFLNQTSIEVDIIGGVVNTIINYKGSRIGFNTDWWGIFYPIQKIYMHLVNLDQTCIIVGNGATAKTAFFVAHHLLHMKVIMYGRSRENIDRFISQQNLPIVGCTSSLELQQHNLSQVGLIISTVPLTADFEYPPQIFTQTPIIMICSYGQTSRLKELGHLHKCKVFDGLDMLIHQAIGQIQLYNGKSLQNNKELKILKNELKKLI